MTAATKPDDELPRLISALEDGALSTQEEARLAELLESDPAARAAYYDHVMLAALLRREGRRAAAHEAEGTLRVPSKADGTQSVPTTAARSRLWLAALAASVLLMLAISVGEATGVTQLVPTIIRIATGEGSLVIEVDDPSVSVTLDGEDVTITGAGIHELKLRPGTRKLIATKDGQPAHTEMVTILKGQRKVVTVTLEPKGPPLAPGEIRRFTGHTGPVWSVDITRDSRRIVSTSQDGTARVWDTATGNEIARFEGHELCVYCAAISPDGQRVLSGSGGSPGVGQPEARRWSLCLWELATGKELKRLDGEADEITSIALSSDGSWALVGGYSGNVMLWDVGAWREIKRIPAAPRVWSVDFSPNESRIVTASGYSITAAGQTEEGCVQVWNLADGQELQRFEGHQYGVWKAVFSPSGNQIASTGGDRTIGLWNAQTGALDRRFTAREVTTSIAYSADGKYLLVGNYGVGPTVGLWNVETGKEIQSFSGHTLGVQSVAISRDGRWAVSGSHDRALRLWELPAEVHQKMSPKK